MQLNELLKDVTSGPLVAPFDDVDITDLCDDSRKVKPGSLFAALPGTARNGADYISRAVAAGARVVLADSNALVRDEEERALIVRSDDVIASLARLAGRFFHAPDKRIACIGVTGTNGKTTVTYLIESILRQAGETCGVIGTVNYRYGGVTRPSGNTTPGLLDNYRLLAEMAREKVSCCVAEVSSHALAQRRMEGIEFCCGVFTNLTSDHLDYHRDQESYFQAKARLFLSLNEKARAVVNIDDPYGRRLFKMGKGKKVTYGLRGSCDITAERIDAGLDGARFILRTLGGDIDIETVLPGRHNVANIMAAAGACLSQGVSAENIRLGVAGLKIVPGRLEKIEEGQDFRVFVDYAHTEDALKNVLESLRAAAAPRIILVFGCGGDRDRSKRSKMGETACRMADYSILTNDNPRGEDPVSIIEEIKKGFDRNNYEVVVDRAEAIARALDLARPRDVVLVAGKGHEDYQVFKDRTMAFRERDIIRDYLRGKKKG